MTQEDTAGEQPLEAQVTIVRSSEKDNQHRQVIVKLDGERFATLTYGQKATRKVAAGKHRLRVDNTFVWKNVQFSLAPGEHATFQLINRSGRFTWFLVAILGAGPMYLTVERMVE